MANAIEYALMAGASYISNRADIHKFPIPQGWISVIDPPHFKDDTTGFEAIGFTKGSQVVISFAGTDFSQPGVDFLHGNFPLVTGKVSDQFK